MASWATAADLSQRYSVGLVRLLEYSRRGNLPMVRDANGAPVFDEDVVRRLFSSRSSAVVAAGPSLGVLGSTTLGVAAEPQLSQREVRRREIWRSRRAQASGQLTESRQRKTG